MSLFPAAKAGAFAEEDTPSPWILGLAFGSGGFGAASGEPGAERLSALVVLDPFRWKALVPSFGAGLSCPVFPWRPEGALFEARLDLRLFSLRSHPFGFLLGDPSLLAPLLSAAICLPLSGGEGFGAVGITVLSFRTGDGVYSFLTISALLSPGSGNAPGFGYRGCAVKLFEFTHFIF